LVRGDAEKKQRATTQRGEEKTDKARRRAEDVNRIDEEVTKTRVATK